MSSQRNMEIQHRAVRENAGIFNRSKRGKVRAEGADCLRFLHGMVTNTVESLAQNKGNYAAVTSARGTNAIRCLGPPLTRLYLYGNRTGTCDKVN